MSYLKNRRNGFTKHKCPVCPAKFALLKNYQKHILTHGVRDLYKTPKPAFSGFLHDRHEWELRANRSAMVNQYVYGTGSEACVSTEGSVSTATSEKDITFANNMTFISGEDLVQSSDIVITQQPVLVSPSKTTAPQVDDLQENGDVTFVGLSCDAVDDEDSQNNSEGLRKRKQDSDTRTRSSVQDCQSDSDISTIDLDDDDVSSEKITGGFDVSKSLEHSPESSGCPSASSHTLTSAGISSTSGIGQLWSATTPSVTCSQSRTMLNRGQVNHSQSFSGSYNFDLAKECAVDNDHDTSIQTCVKKNTEEKSDTSIGQPNVSQLKHAFSSTWKWYSGGSSTIKEFEEMARKLSSSFLQRFRCRYCGLRFYHFDDYSKHVHAHRKRLFRIRNVKRKHLYGRSFVPRTETGANKIGVTLHTCCVCGKDFTGAAWVVHSYGRCIQRRQCQYCDEYFDSREQMRHHETLHLSVTPYRCARCGEAFAIEKYYKMHKAKCDKYFDMTEQERRDYDMLSTRYKCFCCGEVFAIEEYYTRHMVKRYTIGSCKRRRSKQMKP